MDEIKFVDKVLDFQSNDIYIKKEVSYVKYFLVFSTQTLKFQYRNIT